MDDASAQTIHLKDYTPFPWEITSVHLTFRLSPKATHVISKIGFAPRAGASGPFFLHGEGLKLISAKIDGKAVSPVLTDNGLTCDVPTGAFTWEAEVEIAPADNTSLEGLYMSNGMYCTQCEAEGFRHITFYPDRPDVMARFAVRIESDLPVLLSNGNPGARGKGFAEWDDPWPKPAYLFALVAGDLVEHGAEFTTKSGTSVHLGIWVRKGDEDKCAYAMDSLIRSMKWDEDVYGREYDLSVFNIVAVDDFNMGAMENKGLNIFNSKYVLASPETATDTDYALIEGIIAHEYFHNWTGNRITCRDWFQLSLKEGLTVFRDQQFSGDMRSKPVQRIEDVMALRSRQFREDMGPLAHPVRPESYIEINNFYTATVYDKGAEVIGMLKTLVGDAGYKKALDLYFDRHDGEATTIEAWLNVFQDATGRDLSHFKRWYSQAGTPRLSWTDNFKDGTYTIEFTQETPPTPGQPDKAPQLLPIAFGLLNPNGDEVLPTTVLEMTQATQAFSFAGLGAKPIPSVLRGFSAPALITKPLTSAERAFLLAHDTDAFNRWEAGRTLGRDVLLSMNDGADPDPAWLDAMRHVVLDDSLDPAFRALTLVLPGDDEVAQSLHEQGRIPDPDKIWSARRLLKKTLAQSLKSDVTALFERLAVAGPYAPDAEPAGRRALRGALVSLLSEVDEGRAAEALFASADNMTESLAALSSLLMIGKGAPQVRAFYERWQNDRLVIDKWFSMQVVYAGSDKTAAVAQSLSEHKDFDWKNPNRFRSVIGPLAMNHAGFHHASGASYRLLADWLIRLDPVNPQTTARMSGAFETWKRYDPARQGLMKAEIERILASPTASKNTTEMLTRILHG
jgi:aminopeptidase N